MRVARRLAVGLPTWVPVAAGLLALYGSTYADLSRTLWRTDELAHGPLILAAVAALVWSARGRIFGGRARPSVLAGALLLALGLAGYVLGRALQIALAEVGSQIPVLAGLLLLMRGPAAVRAAAFPLAFLAFMLPLPGILLEGIQAALKVQVSALTESLLYHAGYPVARQGVVLTVGQYRLLVADACSGLHSIISLAALGVLFVHLVGRASRWHNGILLASVLPIAFAANVARVLVLALLTFSFGDQAGRGFLHASAGLLLFAIALAALLGLDAALARVLAAERRPRAATA